MSTNLSTDPPIADSTVRLPDGRMVAYLEVGTRNGSPIFHFHGHGSSRLEARLIAAAATAVGVRLIALDRPGIGRSSPKPGARILDWPDDVAEVADQLEIERFAVEGVSGGGAYAMACACAIPHRLTSCGLISSVPPVAFMRRAGPWRIRTMWSALARLPSPLGRFFVRLSMRPIASAGEANLEKYLIRSAAQLGTADQRLLGDAETRRLFAQAVVESYRQGLQANLDQAITLVKPWGFGAEAIAFENVYLWHGEQDRIIPVGPARLLAQALPHCTATFFPTDGHLSTVANHAEAILSQLGS
jgi:pimeloyl-ACP methyl ester carboxylesterase